MANKSALTKISVTTSDGRVDLCSINKNESLDANIKDLCKRFSLPSDTIYGLKIVNSNDGKVINNFVTEDNYDDIKDGYSLKITYSLDFFVKRIFENLNNLARPQSFEYMLNFSSDPGFLRELASWQGGELFNQCITVKQEKHDQLLNLLANELNEKELMISLITFLNLLKKNCFKNIPREIIRKIINIIKSDSSKPEQLQPALAVLCQILYLKTQELHPLKIEIVNKIGISDLMPYIWSEEQKGLQMNTLMLINAMVKVVKGERKEVLVKEMNLRQNKEKIFTYIIEDKNSIDNIMAHELYVYQTHLMSLYKEALESYVDLSSSLLFKKEEFELNDRDDVSTFLEFEDVSLRSRQNSADTLMDTLMEDIESNFNFSLTSGSTRESIATICSNFSDLSTSSNGYNRDRVKICHLTLENLRYYKNMHSKNFRKSLIEETAYEPGIYVTSEKVTQILAKLLHVGKHPEKYSQFYQPLIFNTKLKYPFFPEMFSRTMWLLSKTRREMKASTKEDYPKVLRVLEKQIMIVLDKKPFNYKQLTEELDRTSFKEVSKQWEVEKSKEWDEILATNPSVQELKKTLTENNEKLIRRQRIGVLQNGEKFPKLPQKKGKLGHMFIKLSENKRTILWRDHDYNKNNAKEYFQTFNVADIKHLIVGNACPHVKDNTVKEPKRAFTLMFNDDVIINFFAKDVKTANYWIDGFNLLLEKENRSDLYKEELESLVKMDCTLQLLELQEIDLPKTPPPIPPLPPGCGPKPAVPPKSQNLMLKICNVSRKKC